MPLFAAVGEKPTKLAVEPIFEIGQFFNYAFHWVRCYRGTTRETIC
jgi:hypothetical protein